MEFTPEELAKQREKLKKEQEENLRLIRKEEHYKNLIKKGDFNIQIKWRDKTSELDMEFYKKIFDNNFYEGFAASFSVVYLQLDRVLNFHCKSEKEADKIYPKNKLWDYSIGRSNRTTVKLLEYIESGNALNPPVIDISEGNIILFYDGNHRVALARYLGLSEIPFAVRTVNIERLKKL